MTTREPAVRGRGKPGLQRAVAVPAVLALLLGGAALDVAGASLVPTASALILGVLALFHLRSRGESVVPVPGTLSLRDGHLRPGDLLVLAVAVLGASAALELARPWMAAWTRPPRVPESLAAPLFRLGMGGTLLATVALLMIAVPRFRRRLREFASSRRLRSGLFFTVAVVAVAYGILLGVGHAVAGPGALRFQIPVFVPASLAVLFGQMAIAVGEEAFYRGLLQGEVTRLLGRAGIRRPRDRKLASLTAVSLLFALHHVGPSMSGPRLVSVMVYAFAMSLLFGFLFDLTRNLAVCSFAHLFNNLMVLRLGPSLAAPGAVEAFGDGVYVAAYLLVAFSFLFMIGRESSESIRAIRPT